MTINQYFDNIYVLNLHRRKDRKEAISKRLSEFAINFEIFNGTDGSVMRLVWEKFGNAIFTNPNYLGCCISHLSIYKDAINQGYQRVLIVEDDCLINQSINKIFEELTIPKWEDLFYLGYIPLDENCESWNYGLYGINKWNKYSDHMFNPKNLWGLYSYGITNSLMSSILDIYDSDFPMELDRFFVKEIQPRNKSIAICPQLFCCQDVHSDNLGYTQAGMTIRSIDSRYVDFFDFK